MAPLQSQANPNGHTSFTYLAPYVFKVAISNSRIVLLADRTVTFTYRKVGSARLRTVQLDGMEFLRRFLQHVLPDGFQKVRHFGSPQSSLVSVRCCMSTGTQALFSPALLQCARSLDWELKIYHF
jgi:hypothetical protein